MTVCAVRCERGTGRRQAFSSRSVLFHRAAGLSEAWGFNARVRPHQTEEKAVDQTCFPKTSSRRKKTLRRFPTPPTLSPIALLVVVVRVKSDTHSSRLHDDESRYVSDEKNRKKTRVRTLAPALAAAASHTKPRKAPSRAHRATSPSRGGAAPFSLTPFSQ